MAATKLYVYGPFKIPFQTIGKGRKNKHIYPGDVSDFWEELKKQDLAKDLCAKQGCYVFAMKTTKNNILPYYIGKTKNRSGFEKEAFALHKRSLYNDFLAQGKIGQPLMYLIAPKDSKSIVEKKELLDIEKYLISHAKKKNPSLLNKHHASLPTWSIEGVVRSGKGHPGKKNQEFKRVMGL